MAKYIYCLISLWAIAGSAWSQMAPLPGDIILSDSLKQIKVMEELIVTGQYAPQSLRQSVYNVRVISQERIKMRAATDITGVLNNELGIRFSTDYTLGETDTKIMGLGGQRIKILLDGIPLIDRDGTKLSLAQIDVNNVERIEIVEGPMSVLYGTDALAGVINIITKKNSTKGLTIAGRMQEESIGDSYNLLSGNGTHNENLTLNWRNKNWWTSIYGTRNNMGGYQDTAAYPAKVSKPKDQWLTGAAIGFKGKNIEADYKLDYLNEELWAAGVMFVTNYKGLDQYFITNRFTHQAHIDWNINKKLKLSTALSCQDYKRKTETYTIDYRNQTKIPTNREDPQNAAQWDLSTFKSYFLRTAALWTVSPSVTIQPGIEIKSDKGTGQRIIGQPSITDYALFISSEIKPTQRINIKPGVRFSKNSTFDAPPVVPSLNTQFSLNSSMDLRLSYARGFRAPILRELYFDFHDANHAIEGNANLKAEYSDSYTTSLSWHNKSEALVQLNSVVSGFYNHFHDFINMAYDADRQVYTYFNTSEYKTAGGTLHNTVAYKNLSGTLGFSYVGRYNAYTNRDPGLPEFTWSPEVTANLMYTFSKLKTAAGIFYKFNGSMPAYTTNDAGEIYLARQGSWHLADLTITQPLFKYFTLQTGIRNLLDVKKVNSTASGGAHSSGGPLLAGFGRSYFVGLRFQVTP